MRSLATDTVLFALLLGLAGFGVVGCGATEEVPATTVSVSGRVVGAGGAGVPGVVVGVQPPVVPSAVTDAEGRYSLTVPPGAYAVVPSLRAARGTLAPVSQDIVATGPNPEVNFAVSGYARPHRTVSGHVEYAGEYTGHIWLALGNDDPNLNVDGVTSPFGTRLAGPGPFELRGVTPGTYRLRAYMDPVGATQQHGYSPIGATAALTVGDDGLSGVILKLDDPAIEALAAPFQLEAIPVAGGASVQFQGHPDHEPAESYNLYWSTSPQVSPTHTPGGGETHDIWSWPGSQPAIFVQRGLNDGDDLYFTMTEQRRDTEGPPAETIGPIRIGEVQGDHSFCGTVTFDDFEPTGPLVISVEAPRSIASFEQPWTLVDNPVSPQKFCVNGIADGTYMLIVRFDQNDDGLFWDNDPSEEFFDGIEAPFEHIDGASVRRDVVFSPTRGILVAATTHTRSGEVSSFSINLEVRQLANVPVGMVIVSGPAVHGPVDVWGQRFPERDGFIFQHILDLGVVRPADVPYVVDLTWYDGFSETVELYPRIVSHFPTGLVPHGALPFGTPPQFEWENPELPVGATTFVIVEQDGQTVWTSTALDSELTSVVYGSGPDPGQPLIQGVRYDWRVAIRDGRGDIAETTGTFTLE